MLGNKFYDMDSEGFKLSNELCHRDYTHYKETTMKINDDHIVFSDPVVLSVGCR